MNLIKKTPPKTEEELLARCDEIAGMTFMQLSLHLDIIIPEKEQHRKGWVGQAVELGLGAYAGNQSLPDFYQLGIELKTLPMNQLGNPAESTYVTAIPLLTVHQQTWPSSQCYQKLRRVLWVPVEGDPNIPFLHRRIGQGFIWSPTAEQLNILAADWYYLTTQISIGQLETLDASVGDYLQVRPKAANGKALCLYFDAEGNKVQTLPRGFYLRSRFTQTICKKD